MSTVSNVSSSVFAPRTTASSTGTTTAPGRSTGSKSLGIDDFMKLLATQYEQQDPLKPVDDTAFIAQTAQFTSLQQTNTLVQQVTQLNAQQNISAANSYLGRTVTVDTGSGLTDVGQVTAIDTSGSTPQVVVNGNTYALSTVLRIESTPLSTPNPSTTASCG